MLKFMRKSARSIFVKALLILLIASFAMWGISDVFKSRGSSSSVATIGQTTISASTFKSELAREVRRVQQTINPNITRKQAISMGVGDMLMSRLVNSAILNAGAQDMRLNISKTAILNEIRNSKSFFNDAGVFDRRVFTQLLSNNGLSEEGYIQYLRQGMERDQILSAIYSGATPPAPLIDALYTFEAEKRVLDVLRINYAQIKNVPTPTGSELTTYHEANAQNFMAPEYRSLSALVLNAADIAKTIDLTHQDLQIAYDERAADFMTPETRVLKQILVSDEITAGRAAQLLTDGKTLIDVANEVKANPAMMNIGTLTRDDVAALSSKIADAAFSTAKGSHSAPVKSPLGWHVIVVEDIIPGSVQSLADVKETLSANLKMTKALDQLFQLSNQLEDLLGGGKTFEEAASELGVTLIKAQAVDAQGRTTDGKLATFTFAADIIKEAVKLQAGGESSMTENKDNTAFFVVRVDSVTPSALRPLETVKVAVEMAWDAQKRSEIAATLAQKAQTRLESGEALAKVAKSLGFNSFVTQPFTRNSQGLQQGALPVAVIKQAFTLPLGGVANAPGTGARTVARITAIQVAQKGIDDPVFKSVKDQATRDLQNDLAKQMTEALQNRFPVRVNQSVLNSIY